MVCLVWAAVSVEAALAVPALGLLVCVRHNRHVTRITAARGSTRHPALTQRRSGWLHPPVYPTAAAAKRQTAALATGWHLCFPADMRLPADWMSTDGATIPFCNRGLLSQLRKPCVCFLTECEKCGLESCATVDAAEHSSRNGYASCTLAGIRAS